MTQVTAAPNLRIECNGEPWGGNLLAAVSEVRVQQRLSLPAQCEIGLLNYSAKPLPARASPGASMTVFVNGEKLFQGDVTALEHSYGPSNLRELRVRAYDPLHRLRKRQSVRAHVEVTSAGLARELVAGDGLTVEAPGEGPFYARLIQSVQSDLDLLTDAVSRCGWHMAVRGSVLHLLTLEGRGETIPLELGTSLMEARVEANGDLACRSVTASGWNTGRTEHHKGLAGRPRTGRRVGIGVSPAAMHTAGERSLVDELVEDESQAELLAQAELDGRAANEVTVSGVANGDTRLAPGVPVRIGGVADGFCGRYVLTSVLHVVNAKSGYISEFSTDAPPLRVRPRGTLMALAIVSGVNDPDRLGRVRVILPGYAQVETGWLPVLMAGAGAGKGFAIIPNVDDRVLVLLPREDPVHGIVLGGLHSQEGPQDSGVEQNAVCRWQLRSPSGHRIQFDDARKSLRIEDSQGSYVELAPDRVMLHSGADLKIEAPGHAIRIGAETIDFEKI